MKRKKIVTAVLAAVMAVSVIFTGCGKNEEESSLPPVVENNKTSSAESEMSAESSVQSASSSQESSEVSYNSNTITPMICEISDDEGHILYTMGTIHLADENALNMPDYFETAFNASDALAVECNSKLGGIDLMSVTKFMYTDKTTIRDHVSAEDYYKVVNVVKDSPLYTQVYDYVKPMMWVSLAEVCAASKIGLSESYGVDNLLMDRAEKSGKEILEVEGTEKQFAIIADMPDEIQNLLFHELAATDDYLNEMGKSLDELYKSWKSGNAVEDDNSLNEESFTDEEKQLIDSYYNIMLYDRNEGMADKAEEYLHSGQTVFMAVGLAHFGGEKGIYKLLENRGYKVRQLSHGDAVKDLSSVIKPGESSVSVSETDPAIPRAA